MASKADVLPIDVVRGQKNPLHIRFAARLRRIRKALDLSHAALARTAGIGGSTAFELEQGVSIPRLDTVEHLATALHVSPCFLAFGIEQPCADSTELLCAGLPQRLRDTRTARGLSRLELGRCSETSDTLVRMTETGATLPNLAKLEMLAKALEVSPCWLAFGIGERELSPRRRSAARSAAHT